MSTITLQLNAIAEQKLREQASSRGQTLETYLQQLVEDNVRVTSGSAPDSGVSWTSAWRTWARSHVALPVAADDSRESIYAGRDE